MWAGLFEGRARVFLTDLAERVGVAGWTAVATVPAVAAEVDQHAASVRDILTLGVESSGSVAAVVLLASYARGLIEQTQADTGRAWAPIGDVAGWMSASRLHLRLLAVCQLARAHPAGPLPGGDHPGLPSLA